MAEGGERERPLDVDSRLHRARSSKVTNPRFPVLPEWLTVVAHGMAWFGSSVAINRVVACIIIVFVV